NEVMQSLRAQLKTAIESGAASVGAQGRLEIVGDVPAAEYSQQMVELAKQAIVDVMGADALLPDIVTPGGEDFHFYSQLLPNTKTTYLRLGCDLQPGLHDPNMTFEHQAMENGARVLIDLA